MKKISRFAAPIAFSVAIGMAVVGAAPQERPDNSATNKGDASPAAVTADKQSNSRSDVETTRQIRKAIVADKTLSTYAHNVKIVTQHGKVALRGPVRTEAEKALVLAKATEIAGPANVTSAVTVVPATSSK